MNERTARKLTALRINPEALHKARIAAVTAHKTLGQWLEEAIEEKLQLERESNRGKAVQPAGEMG
ncbi:MAG: hypothetical protein Q8O40_17860 [Chloroflexota bacterium]|nr:hypothetical protein [Chloroflexota bacterium]